MTSQFLIFIIIPIIGLVLLLLNFILAPHNPYKEKKTPFECGYHSWLMQNRNPFSITFFLFGLLFLVFDLEIVLIYPYTMSSSFNGLFGLWSIVIFTIILSLGFMFELGKKALKIDTLQEKNTVKYSVMFNFSLILNNMLLSLITLFGFTLVTKYFFYLLGLHSYVFFVNVISCCLTFIIIRIHTNIDYTKKDIYRIISSVFIFSIIYYLLSNITIVVNINDDTEVAIKEILPLAVTTLYAYNAEYAVLGLSNHGIKDLANFMNGPGNGGSNGPGNGGSNGPGNGGPGNNGRPGGSRFPISVFDRNRPFSARFPSAPTGNGEGNGQFTNDPQNGPQPPLVDPMITRDLLHEFDHACLSYLRAERVIAAWDAFMVRNPYFNARLEIRNFQNIYKGRFLPTLFTDINDTNNLCAWIKRTGAMRTADPILAQHTRESVLAQIDKLRANTNNVSLNTDHYTRYMAEYEQGPNRNND